MRFSEFINTSQNSKVERVSELGALSFSTGKTDKNNTRTPHYEMEQTISMFETNPIVNSSVHQLSLFVIPNQEVKISSKDKRTVEFLEKWSKQRDVIEEQKKWYISKLLTGNPYLERRYTKLEDGQPVLDNVFNINDSSRVYVRPDARNGKGKFIYRVPMGLKQFQYRGREVTPSYIHFAYIKNYTYSQLRIYGFLLDEGEVVSHPTGWSRDEIYGRSPLASALDDQNLMDEILSSWDTISKTRQLDRKILSVSDPDLGMKIDEDKMTEIAQQLEDGDKSYTLINFPLQMTQTDIGVSGKYDLMENVFDITRRKLMMALLPTYLTPWNDSGTTMGAQVSMPPFLQRIKSEQNEIIRFFNSSIIDELRKTYDFIADDATFTFDEPKLIPEDAQIRKVTDLVRDQIISIPVAQKMLSDMGIIDHESLKQLEKEQKSKKDDDDDTNNNESGVFQLSASEDKKKVNDNLKEATSKTEDYQHFIRRAAQIKNLKQYDFSNATEKYFKDIDGKQVRMVEFPKRFVIFDGLVDAEIFKKTDALMNNPKKLKDSFEAYVEKVKELQKDFDDGETDEDKIIDEFEKEVNNELKKVLDKVNQYIQAYSKKEQYEEKVLSTSIFPRVDKLFSKMNTSINKSITNVMNKLSLNVIDGNERAEKPDTKIVKDLKQTKDIMKNSLKSQLKSTSNKMSADVKTVLIDGLTSGKDIKDIRQDVNKAFKWDDKAEKRFDKVIKQTARISSNKLKLLKWKKMGFTKYEWITREDNKVRPNHVRKNRKVFDIEKSLKTDDINAYPGKAWNCRCYPVVYY